MVWLHPKKIKKKKNEETLGSNFRGYTHTHTHTVWLYTQKKEEEGFCDSRGVHKSKKFSRRNIHTTHQVYIEKKFTCDSPSVTRLDLSSVNESDWRSSAINFFSSSHSSSCLKTLISSASPRSSPSLLPFTCGIFLQGEHTQHTAHTHTHNTHEGMSSLNFLLFPNFVV